MAGVIDFLFGLVPFVILWRILVAIGRRRDARHGEDRHVR